MGAMHSDYIVFVDESGDHSLVSIDEQYPVFVLSFCIFSKACYADHLTPAVRKLKFKNFGHEMVVLHESDIRRRKGLFGTLTMEQRAAFMDDLTGLIATCDFTLIAVVIRKALHKAKYNNPEHPYHLALQFGLERLRDFMRMKGQEAATTHVICEARGAAEDAELELAFLRVCDGENRGKAKYPFKLVVASKQTNSEGLQIADLTARPIGLSVVKPEQDNRAYATLREKFFTGSHGVITGNGLKIFP
jgi:hypothetical protein